MRVNHGLDLARTARAHEAGERIDDDDLWA